MKKRIFILIIYCSFVSVAHSQLTLDSTILEIDTVITGLDIPWEITWGPDKRIWTTERFGRVSRINPEDGQQDIVLDISDTVNQSGESGLLGMALHPDFINTPNVFLVYTFGSTSTMFERLSRFEYNGIELINEALLIDSIPASTNHDGSRLGFLSDTTLLMVTGDVQDLSLPQSFSSLNGKTLRLHTDGSIPSDNPYTGNHIYTSGHRNPQGLTIASNGKIYSSEHGPANDDELNIIMAGRNYGWPQVEGFCDQSWETNFCADSNVVEPLVAWTPTIAPSGIEWYDHPSIPEWQNSILIAVLKDKMLVRLKLDSTGNQVIDQDQYLKEQYGRIRDVCVDPDGTVYLATNGESWNNNNPFTHSIISLKNTDITSAKGISFNRQREMHISLHPNPAIDIVTLKYVLWLDEMITLEILDITGNIILMDKFSGNAGTNEQILGLDVLDKGIYFLRIRTEGWTASEKLVIVGSN